MNNEKTISTRSIYIILKNNDFNLMKLTIKPGLTNENKTKRLTWYWRYRDWTLEDWKRVIWMDETNINLNRLRGKKRI
jgi:hypothetical protein